MLKAPYTLYNTPAAGIVDRLCMKEYLISLIENIDLEFDHKGLALLTHDSPPLGRLRYYV